VVAGVLGAVPPRVVAVLPPFPVPPVVVEAVPPRVALSFPPCAEPTPPGVLTGLLPCGVELVRPFGAPPGAPVCGALLLAWGAVAAGCGAGAAGAGLLGAGVSGFFWAAAIAAVPTRTDESNKHLKTALLGSLRFIIPSVDLVPQLRNQSGAAPPLVFDRTSAQRPIRNRLGSRSLVPKFVVCGFEDRKGSRKGRRQQELFHHWTSHRGPYICADNFLPALRRILPSANAAVNAVSTGQDKHARPKRKSGVKNLHPAELIPRNVFRRPVYAGVSPAQSARPQEATSKPAPASVPVAVKTSRLAKALLGRSLYPRRKTR